MQIFIREFRGHHTYFAPVIPRRVGGCVAVAGGIAAAPPQPGTRWIVSPSRAES